MADQLTDDCVRCPSKSLPPEKSILYNLLITPTVPALPPSLPHAPANPGDDCDVRYNSRGQCRCATLTTVTLRNPHSVHQHACQALLRTVRFVRNLATFNDLDPGDRSLLLTSGWSDLFTLGLAQSRVQFSTVPTGGDSRHRGCQGCVVAKLRGQQNSVSTETVVTTETEVPTETVVAVETDVPTETDVGKIRGFVERCQGLDLDMKEYSYLMAALLFNPDVPGLADGRQVEVLQNSAQQSLNEYTAARYPLQPLRFARILLGLPALRSIKAKVITELFFRPLIGAVDMEVILTDMLLKGC